MAASPARRVSSRAALTLEIPSCFLYATPRGAARRDAKKKNCKNFSPVLAVGETAAQPDHER